MPYYNVLLSLITRPFPIRKARTNLEVSSMLCLHHQIGQKMSNSLHQYSLSWPCQVHDRKQFYVLKLSYVNHKTQKVRNFRWLTTELVQESKVTYSFSTMQLTNTLSCETWSNNQFWILNVFNSL